MNEKRNANGLTESEFLSQYNPGNYDKPSVTVDTLVFGMNETLDSLKVLLIKRKDHPFIGCWALPGGFINMDESAHMAACRKLAEETGLTDVYLEQLYTMSAPNRDPRMRIISIAYMALIPTVKAQAGDDAEEALWFDITFDEHTLRLSNKEKNINITYLANKHTFKNGVVKGAEYRPIHVDGEGLAFDHADLLIEGLLRLRNKVEYTDIAFNLMPKAFTLPDLQQVYEIILGKCLYRSNFRASMLGKIEPLNKKGVSIIGNKKSQLFKVAN